MPRRTPLIALLAVALTVAACGGDADAPRGTKQTAYVRCRQYIRDELTDVESFEFPDISTLAVSVANGVWVLSDDFQAQDSEGDWFRSAFECKAAYEGDGEWRLVDLTLSRLEPTATGQPCETPRRAETTEHSTGQDGVRFGYGEEERKKIYQEVVRAEDRAQNEAEYYYPTPDPMSESYSQEAMEAALESQMDYYDEHAPECKSEVAQEFGLTTDQLREIIVEGTEKEWPLPSPPTPISD